MGPGVIRFNYLEWGKEISKISNRSPKRVAHPFDEHNKWESVSARDKDLLDDSVKHWDGMDLTCGSED
jgi:hypothetical protein